MSPKFQTMFNQAKGSIPARLDIDLSKGFNPCQQLSQKDLQASIADGTLVRSMAHNMTILQKYRGAIMDVITTFVNNARHVRRRTPRTPWRTRSKRRSKRLEPPRGEKPWRGGLVSGRNESNGERHHRNRRTR